MLAELDERVFALFFEDARSDRAQLARHHFFP
jgi:hypothetical protein